MKVSEPRFDDDVMLYCDDCPLTDADGRLLPKFFGTGACKCPSNMTEYAELCALAEAAEKEGSK